MKLGPKTYVPSVRWRMGEYQALFRLKDDAKSRIVPFVMVPEVEFDFEEWKPKKTVSEHVEPFPKRFKAKWADRPAWIDTHSAIATVQMDSGLLPLTHIFTELRTLGSAAVPVVSIDAPHELRMAVRDIVAADSRGVGIRARLEHIMMPSYGSMIAALIAEIGVSTGAADLIVDLASPAYEPYDEFADALIANLQNIGNLWAFRSFVIMGSGFPETLGINKPGGTLVRHDWRFFKHLAGKLPSGHRLPNYGDYTIVHPAFTPQDMRKIKSAGKIIYTAGDTWIVRKGGAFRDNPAQMHTHCQDILNSGQFRGESFSDGDSYIKQCAAHVQGPSNQPRWKQVAINHHIMHVLDDLSSLNVP